MDQSTGLIPQASQVKVFNQLKPAALPSIAISQVTE